MGHDHALETLNAALALQEDFEVLGAVITEEDLRDYPEKAAAAAKLCKVLTIEQAEKLRPEAAAIETEDEYLAKYGVLCAKKGCTCTWISPPLQTRKTSPHCSARCVKAA